MCLGRLGCSNFGLALGYMWLRGFRGWGSALLAVRAFRFYQLLALLLLSGSALNRRSKTVPKLGLGVGRGP